MTRALGVDVGGTAMKAVVLDGGEVAARLGPEPLPPAGVLDWVLDRVPALAARHAADAVGVGLAGLVEHPSGRFLWGPHIPEGPHHLREPLEADTGIPVAVDNDATCAAVAEWRLGVLAGRRDAAVLTVGTGIGAGFVLGGRVHRGGGLAGEAGHVRVQGASGPCACGRTGCWETVVSGARLDREAARILGAGAGGADLVAAASGGDPEAARVLVDAGTALGLGIVSLVLLLDLEAVALAGAVSDAGDLLLDPARAAIASDLAGASHRPPVQLAVARFGPWAGAVGAAVLGAEMAETAAREMEGT